MVKDAPQPREHGLNERIPRTELNKLADGYLTKLAVKCNSPLKSAFDLEGNVVTAEGHMPFNDDLSNDALRAHFEIKQEAKRLTPDTITISSTGRIAVAELGPENEEDAAIVDWAEFSLNQTYDNLGIAIESIGSIIYGEAESGLPYNLPRSVATYGDIERIEQLRSARFFTS